MPQPPPPPTEDAPAPPPAQVDVNTVYTALAEEHGRAVGELTHLRLLRTVLERQVHEQGEELRYLRSLNLTEKG